VTTDMTMCDKRGSIDSLAVVIAETCFYKPLVRSEIMAASA
jgi:hypothetical protein